LIAELLARIAITSESRPPPRAEAWTDTTVTPTVTTSTNPDRCGGEPKPPIPAPSSI
jgi:hypothetical protein